MTSRACPGVEGERGYRSILPFHPAHLPTWADDPPGLTLANAARASSLPPALSARWGRQRCAALGREELRRCSGGTERESLALQRLDCPPPTARSGGRQAWQGSSLGGRLSRGKLEKEKERPEQRPEAERAHGGGCGRRKERWGEFGEERRMEGGLREAEGREREADRGRERDSSTRPR